MAKKKKKGSKKKKKKEEKKEEEFDEFPELNALTIGELEGLIPNLEEKLEILQVQRNYMQLERDQVATYYEITKKEVKQLELEIQAKDREMEIMEENHKVEERVYIQKVRHLEYQHKINIDDIENKAKEKKKLLVSDHEKRVKESVLKKGDHSARMREQLESNATEIRVLMERNAMALKKFREGFEDNLNAMEAELDEKTESLRKNLELQRKVEIHEIEERKNLHIHTLLQSHESAFKQIKEYYNAITRDNVKLIKDLKNEVTAMKEKAETTQKSMVKISHENKHLKGPLKEALDEVQQLKDRLKDRGKNVLALRNAKARSRSLDKELALVEKESANLESRYKRIERERDELYGSFKESLRSIQRQSELKNLVMQKRLSNVSSELEERNEELQQIAKAARLDQFAVKKLTQELDSVIDGKQREIEHLKFQIAKVAKSHDDACRTFEQKLEEFDVPHDEHFLDKSVFLCTATSAPAGLVVE